MSTRLVPAGVSVLLILKTTCRLCGRLLSCSKGGRLAKEDDAALRSVAEIVHDIDLKDGKFGRPETQGIANLLAGIAIGLDDDDRRIERGSALFEDLYRFFSAVK